MNKPVEEGMQDTLQTIRFFFADPKSKDPLEKQIKKKFDEVDVDKSGALDKKEFKELIMKTINKDQVRFLHQLQNGCA